MLYNDDIESEDAWREVKRFFLKEKYKPQHMIMKKFYTDNKFGLLIDLRSMASQEMHGSGIQLEIDRDGKGSGNVNCDVFIISDSQLNIEKKHYHSMQN